jgi:hypothetical protein
VQQPNLPKGSEFNTPPKRKTKNGESDKNNMEKRTD